MLPGSQTRSSVPHSFSKHKTSRTVYVLEWGQTLLTSIKTLSLKLHIEISGFLTSDVEHLFPNGRKSLMKIRQDQSRNVKWILQKCEIIKITFCVFINFLTLAVNRIMKIQKETLSSCHATVFFTCIKSELIFWTEYFIRKPPLQKFHFAE